MNPYDQYRQLIDEVLEHECVGIYSREMCASCRVKYAQAQELERAFGDHPLWEQLSLALPA